VIPRHKSIKLPRQKSIKVTIERAGFGSEVGTRPLKKSLALLQRPPDRRRKRLKRPNSGLSRPLALSIDGREQAAQEFFNGLGRF
jgi:hypothetical protein